MLGTFYFGFWAFIYEFAWYWRAWQSALMLQAVSVTLCILCFMAWVILEMWIKDPSSMPTFKIERRKKKAKTEDKSTTKDEEEKLPIY